MFAVAELYLVSRCSGKEASAAFRGQRLLAGADEMLSSQISYLD